MCGGFAPRRTLLSGSQNCDDIDGILGRPLSTLRCREGSTPSSSSRVCPRQRLLRSNVFVVLLVVQGAVVVQWPLEHAQGRPGQFDYGSRGRRWRLLPLQALQARPRLTGLSTSLSPSSRNTSTSTRRFLFSHSLPICFLRRGLEV